MKKNDTPILDNHLPVLEQVTEVGTDDFFYTRLIARMEKEQETTGWGLPVKPVWVIGTLLLFLALNFFTLFGKTKSVSDSGTSNSLSDFASSYDQTISTTIQ